MALEHNTINNSENYYIFNNPKRQKDGRYLASIEKSIYFKLPQMKINKLEKKDNRWDVSYLLDIENNECNKLIEFLYNLDSSALYRSEENSLNWFKKKLKSSILEESYVPSYDTDDDNNLLFNLNLYNSKFKNLLNSPHIATVKVEGLEFYRNNFKYSIIITNVEPQDSFEVESRLDFIKCLDKSRESNPLNEDVINNLADTDDINNQYESNNQENYDSSDNDSDNNSNDINLENENNNLENENNSEHEDSKSTLSKIEIKSIISQKRQEVKSCFENAERANKCAEQLRIKAIKVASELRNIESMYEDSD